MFNGWPTLAHRLFLAAFGRLCLEVDFAVSLLSRYYLGVEFELETLFCQQPLELLANSNLSDHFEYAKTPYSRNFVIDTNTADTSQKFDHGHFGPKTTPDTAHLQTNDTASDDDELLWHFLEFKCTS